MIRTLMATTALVSLLASGAYAQDTTAPATTPAPATENAMPAAPIARAEGSLVGNIIGESVYNGPGDDAEKIGKVNDVVFDKDGNAQSVVIGVGGFLGVGAKNVTFDFGKLQWAEKNGDRWLVAPTTKEELTAQQEFDAVPYQPLPATPQVSETMPTDTLAPEGTLTAPADGTVAPADSAQNEPVDMNAAPVERADGKLATNIIGESVYNGSGDDAENIGDVNDIVLSKNGDAESLVIGVGGFLGLGEKSVAFAYDKAQWTEKDGDRWLVVQGSKEELEALPAFDRRAYDPAPPAAAADANTPATTTPTTDTAQTEPDAMAPANDAGEQAAQAPATPETAPADEQAAQAPATPETAPTDEQAAQAPATPDAVITDETETAAIDRSTLTEMPMGDIRAENLVGTTVYGAGDTNVGEIGDVVLTPDSKVDAVIIDVGGFLGMGEKEIAVGMDNLKFMTDKDGNRYLYTNFTKEQLEAQTAYDKGSYAQKRDEQRLNITQ